MARKKKTRAKTVKRNPTGEMVLTAIKKLTRNTGWTARTIVKFIKMEYSVNDPTLSRQVSRALKRGVRLGLLRMDHGRYRLNVMSRLLKSAESNDTHFSELSDQKYKQASYSNDRPLRLHSNHTVRSKKRKRVCTSSKRK